MEHIKKNYVQYALHFLLYFLLVDFEEFLLEIVGRDCDIGRHLKSSTVLVSFKRNWCHLRIQPNSDLVYYVSRV